MKMSFHCFVKPQDKLPPSLLSQGQSPALQFVSSVCHVLELHKQNAEAVYNLKRDLLKLIQVDAFAPEAEFRDPAPTFVLQDVICEYCTFAHNLNLLRDALLVAHRWECSRCGHSYDKAQIEITLVDMAYALSYAYQSQDMICSKCKLVKEENLSDICRNCSGVFVCRLGAAEFSKKLATMQTIATFHSMLWLDSVVKALLATHKHKQAV